MTAEVVPTCTHCGEPFSPESRVFTTFGGTTRDDYPWHFDRGHCLDAARAHPALTQEAGRAVPPNRPEGSST